MFSCDRLFRATGSKVFNGANRQEDNKLQRFVVPLFVVSSLFPVAPQKRRAWACMQAPTPDSDNNPYHVFRQRAKPNKPQTRRRRETQEESLEKLRSIHDNLSQALSIAEICLLYTSPSPRD